MFVVETAEGTTPPLSVAFNVDKTKRVAYLSANNCFKEATMAKELFIGTHGSEDPTKATLPFLMAGGALDSGHQTAIIVVGDAVVVMDDAVAESVQGVGFPPLKELFDKVVDNKVPIYV